MMNKIKAILIDDELNARDNLRFLLHSFCPNLVDIVGEASNVDQAIHLIKTKQPDVVFLDVEMPNKTGFDLINAFKEINFCVIFVTAYDKYAIRAFEVSAVDYLLKPVDIDRLTESIEKVKKNILFKGNNKRIKALKENTKTKKLRHLSIPYKSDYIILSINDIVVIEANRMYSVFHTSENKNFLYAKKLSFFEQLFEETENFYRVHRSWMINIKSIKSYSKKDNIVMLNNNMKIPVSRSNKKEFELILGF